MAESGIDLSYDDLVISSFQRKGVSPMPSTSSSSSSTMATGQPRVRRTQQLRTAQRMALAKQQAEQLQQQQRGSSGVVTDGKAGCVALSGGSGTNLLSSSVRPLPVIQAESMSLGGEDPEVNQNIVESVADVTGRTAPARFSFHSAHNPTSQLWSNSAPDMLMTELIHPTSSAATSYSELDEQLDDIVSSIENELGTPQSYLSGSSVQDGSYRGGRRKEPPPPDMTPEQRLAWEMERRKKDTHNDIEKRRRYKINDCIQELGNMLPDSYDPIYKEPANSKGAILSATVEYIRQLQDDQQTMLELKSQVEKLELSQRQLLLQREALRAALVAAQSNTPQPVTQLSPAAVVPLPLSLSVLMQPPQSATAASVSNTSPSPHVIIDSDCYLLPVVDSTAAEDAGMDVTAAVAAFGFDDILMDEQNYLDTVGLM